MVRRGNFTFYICLNWPHDFSFINDRLEHYGTLWGPHSTRNDYDYQDNWILDNAYGRSAVVDIDGNPEAMIFKSPSDVADVCVKHRLGNTFRQALSGCNAT